MFHIVGAHLPSGQTARLHKRNHWTQGSVLSTAPNPSVPLRTSECLKNGSQIYRDHGGGLWSRGGRYIRLTHNTCYSDQFMVGLRLHMGFVGKPEDKTSHKNMFNLLKKITQLLLFLAPKMWVNTLKSVFNFLLSSGVLLHEWSCYEKRVLRPYY